MIGPELVRSPKTNIPTRVRLSGKYTNSECPQIPRIVYLFEMKIVAALAMMLLTTGA